MNKAYSEILYMLCLLSCRHRFILGGVGLFVLRLGNYMYIIEYYLPFYGHAYRYVNSGKHHVLPSKHPKPIQIHSKLWFLPSKLSGMFSSLRQADHMVRPAALSKRFLRTQAAKGWTWGWAGCLLTNSYFTEISWHSRGI